MWGASYKPIFFAHIGVNEVFLVWGLILVVGHTKNIFSFFQPNLSHISRFCAPKMAYFFTLFPGHMIKKARRTSRSMAETHMIHEILGNDIKNKKRDTLVRYLLSVIHCLC